MINMINRFFSICLGLIIVIYIIYLRFFIIRLPKDLYFFQSELINYKIIIFIIISIFICLLLFIKNICILLKKNSSKGLFSKLLFKINVIVDDAFFELYKVILRYIPKASDHISFISQKYYAYFKNKTEALFIVILYSIRFFIVAAFLIDVFCFFTLQYMYKAIFFLCFSLMIKFLFYIIRDFSNNASEIEETLIIQCEGVDKATNSPLMSYKFKKDYEGNDLEYFVLQYILCNKLTGYFVNYDKYYSYLSPRLNIVIYGLYLAGWLYIIYVNLTIFVF